MRTIKLAASALSAIDVDVFSGYDDEVDPPSYGILRDCVDARGVLTVPVDPANAKAVVDALDHLANAHDERAHYLGASKDERAFALRASRTLTTTADRVRAIIRG